MAKDYTDAKFTVVSGPYRVGDPHRDPKRKRWRYVGFRDHKGMMLWYRPPLVRRWQWVLAAIAAPFVWVLGWALVAVLLAHH